MYPEDSGPQSGLANLWSAKDSSCSVFRVPAEANMMVVSRSAMMPDTALAAVMHACVPLFPAWSAESTRDTWRHQDTAQIFTENHFVKNEQKKLLTCQTNGSDDK